MNYLLLLRILLAVYLIDGTYVETSSYSNWSCHDDPLPDNDYYSSIDWCSYLLIIMMAVHYAKIWYYQLSQYEKYVASDMTNKELSPRLAPWLKYVHTADFNLEVLKNCILFAELCHLKLILKITQDMDKKGQLWQELQLCIIWMEDRVEVGVG